MFEIGNSLREARFRQGLDFPEIEQATKIRGKYLRALEEENFEQLPAQTYVKGFLRTYADYLGLEGQLYVDEYNTRYVTGVEEEVPLRVRGGSGLPRTHRLQSSAVLISLTAIGLATALVIAAWKFGAAGDRGTELPGLSTAEKTQAAKKSKHKNPKRRAAVVAHLRITAAYGDSWLEVHRGSPVGPLEYEGTLYKGTSQRFEGKRLWFTMGAPGNLVVRVNGRRRPLPADTGPLDATVTPRGLRTST
ncbi:MAG: helix-turn-helix domain-containing protein [Gaiellaceae bacterium]